MVIKWQPLEPEGSGSWITHEAQVWAKKEKKKKKSQQNDFQVERGRHQSGDRITAVPELLLTSSTLQQASAFSQISPVSPFKCDIKGGRREKRGTRSFSPAPTRTRSLISVKPLRFPRCKARARARISTSVEGLIHIHSANLQGLAAALWRHGVPLTPRCSWAKCCGWRSDRMY